MNNLFLLNLIAGLIAYWLVRSRKLTEGSAKDSANKAAAYVAAGCPLLAYTTYQAQYYGAIEEYFYLLLIDFIILPTLSYFLVYAWKSMFGAHSANRGGVNTEGKSPETPLPDHFAQAHKEIKDGAIDAGLWAIAYSNTTSEEEAKKRYINLRAEQLRENYQLSKNKKKESMFGGWGCLFILIIVAILIVWLLN